MRQKIFTPKYSEFLEANVASNLAKYNDAGFDWETESNGEVRELDFEQPDLSEMMNYADTNRATDDFHAAKSCMKRTRTSCHHFRQLKAISGSTSLM